MKKILQNPIFRKILYSLLGFVVLILLLDNLIMPWFVSSPETKVPQVVGLQLSEAVSTLEAEGFEP
jgi:beta-lactam-binding protein with PASTA domain